MARNSAHGKGREVKRLFISLVIYVGIAAVIAVPTRFLLRRISGMDSPSIWVQVAVVFCWMLVLLGIINAILRIHRRFGRPQEQWRVIDEVLVAFDRLAKGDFNVVIESDESMLSHGLASKVNELAAKLGDIDRLRQDFVSDVSHEIQSPLTSIRGFARLLQDDGLSDEQKRHYAEIIEKESIRMSKLSDNLLKLSMLGSEHVLDPAEYRLDKQIEDILLTLEPQWSAKGIELDIALERVSARLDRDLLEQVWINLISNAIKFTPEGGRITVDLTRVDGGAECVISDTGIGIPEEDQPRIFERFYKVDKARDRSLGGNGLGLSLVHKIVAVHNGTISVKSKPGHGSAFTVLLPDMPQAAPAN